MRVNAPLYSLNAGEVSKIEAAIASLRTAVEGGDTAAIKRAADDLQRASHAIAELLYKGSQGSRGSQGSQGSQGSEVKDAEVVEAS